MIRKIASSSLTGGAVGAVLLMAFAVGAPNFDEFLVVLPIMTFELLFLYAATLAVIHLPVVACLRAAGQQSLIRLVGFVLWPAPVLLLRLIGLLFHWNKRPTLAKDIEFLFQNPGMSIPLLVGLVVAGVMFARAVGDSGHPVQLGTNPTSPLKPA